MVSPKGRVQSVSGLIDPKDLGVTLMHEHLFIDCTLFWEKPPDLRYAEMAKQPLKIENLGWIRIKPFQSYENMVLGDESAAVQEANEFKAMGGRTIVDVTPQDIGRDPLGQRKVSRLTGLNVICGTSHYQMPSHPKDMPSRSVKDVTNEFVKDIQEGIGDTGVKAGIIGEVGSSFPWHANEKKACTAAAKAQQETGAPISLHPSRDRATLFDIIRLFKKEGADLERVVMGHSDTRLSELKDFEAVADKGCYVQLDTFGLDRLHLGQSPSDKQRVKTVAQMVKDGYTDQLLISQDVCMKSQLRMYGGYGYSHILENILPALRSEGVTDKEIEQIMVKNPMRVLTFS
jgi:phosphotriesterase-related protein